MGGMVCGGLARFVWQRLADVVDPFLVTGNKAVGLLEVEQLDPLNDDPLIGHSRHSRSLSTAYPSAT